MSLAKLTALSTTTLSLLLERQRLQTMSRPPPTTSLPQIKRNLDQLRFGILDMERREGVTEGGKLLRSQHERMRGMLGEDGSGVDRIPPLDEEDELDSESHKYAPPPLTTLSKELSNFVPYSDEPTPAANADENSDPMELLQQQRVIMDEQDTHLTHLSKSINRQRDISIQINEELDVHTGLLEELDHEVDITGGRLAGARKRLARVAKGIKGNGSVVTIGVLIFILLILIIVFKT